MMIEFIGATHGFGVWGVGSQVSWNLSVSDTFTFYFNLLLWNYPYTLLPHLGHSLAMLVSNVTNDYKQKFLIFSNMNFYC